jgi:hypothetical protein
MQMVFKLQAGNIRASAASIKAASAMEGVVETHNGYTALTSLGTT